ERATRVEQPMIDGAFDAGAHGHIDAHLLVDSITSASSSTGTAGGIEFTERRVEGGISYVQDLGRIKLGLEGRYSTESDYFSKYVGATAEFSLLDQNTTLRLTAGHGFDTVTNGVVADTSITVPLVEKPLGTSLSSITLAQVLGRDLVASLTYDLMVLD